jgi:uncharacterized membrane protein YphA (DoxX/SURF4 family)
MKSQKITFSMIRISLGIFFLYSAWLKLFPIEPLEFALISQGIATFMTAPILSRLLIGTEFALGIFLILGIHSRIVYRVTLILLAVFSIYIVYIWSVFGSTENCGCMGEGFYMTPFESLLKNILLAGIVLVLLKFKELEYSVRWKVKLLVILSLLISFFLPPILNPPDFYSVQFADAETVEYPIDTAITNSFIINGKPLLLSKGEHIVAFLSLACPHCKLAATKLMLIKKELGSEMPETVMLFLGKPADVQPFLQETKSKSFPWYTVSNPSSFYKLAGNSFPAIYYIKDGIVKKKWNLIQLSPEAIQKISSKI